MVADKKYNIQQHISREKHTKGLKLRKETETSNSQALLIGMTTKSEFNEELCGVFLTCNIPLSKLNILTFKHFLEKHTKQIIPDESTLRKNYVDSCQTNI